MARQMIHSDTVRQLSTTQLFILQTLWTVMDSWTDYRKVITRVCVGGLSGIAQKLSNRPELSRPAGAAR